MQHVLHRRPNSLTRVAVWRLVDESSRYITRCIYLILIKLMYVHREIMTKPVI